MRGTFIQCGEFIPRFTAALSLVLKKYAWKIPWMVKTSILPFILVGPNICHVIIRTAFLQLEWKYHFPQNNSEEHNYVEIPSFSRRILYVREEKSSGIVAAGLVAKIVTGDSKGGRAAAENCCVVIVPRRETNTHPAPSRIFSITSGPAIVLMGEKETYYKKWLMENDSTCRLLMETFHTRLRII